MFKLNVQYFLWTGLAFVLSACSNGTQFALPSTSDNFAQSVSYNNKVDIVFVVDNSTSMDLYQNNLIAQIPATIDRLNGLKMDYHIAVISTSVKSTDKGGIFIGSPTFLTNATSNLVSSLQDRIRLGSHGSDTEAGLQNFINIFTSNYVDTQAPGFFRSDALMALITLSDDDENSTLTSTAFAQKMDSLKPLYKDGTRSWIYNYIGTLNLQSPCHNIFGTVTVGQKHVDLANLTGGVQSSICDTTLSNAVSKIHMRIAQILTDYHLSKIPKVDTIRVVFNGQVIPQDATNGWTYNASTNVITFHGTAVPPADTSIAVTFDPSSAN